MQNIIPNTFEKTIQKTTDKTTTYCIIGCILIFLGLIFIILYFTGFFKKENMTEVNIPNKKIVLYYANWCPHCVDFEPIWNKLETKEKLKQMYIFEKYDCAKDKTCEKESAVEGFPTIIIYKNNNKILYPSNLKRTEQNVEEFMMNN